MTEKPYSKREIDTLHQGLHEKLDVIYEQVKFTNGKVKKITFALVGIGAFSVGLGLKEANTVLSLIL